MRSTSTLVPAVSAALVSAAACAGEIYFLGNVPYSYVDGISGNGRIAAGHDTGTVWHWNPETWVTFIEGALPPGQGVGGRPGITADGARVVCSTLQDPTPQKTEATMFTIADTGYSACGSLGYNCDIERCGSWDMNATGSWNCGLIWQANCAAKGYLWDEATRTFRLMPEVYFYKPTRANGLSADGSVVAGWNDDYGGYRQGCLWRRDGAGNYAATLLRAGVGTTAPKCREANVVSGNGEWVYGMGRTDVDGGAPYRWSQATGYQSILPVPETGGGYVHAANTDGSKVLITFGTTYLWISGRGYVPINDWALEHGLTVPEEWTLAGMCMSEDGLAFGGFALRNDGIWSPFVLDLHPVAPPCPADLNGDGVVNGADLSALLGAWGPCASSPCPADLTGDGVVNGADLSALLGSWGQCPT